MQIRKAVRYLHRELRRKIKRMSRVKKQLLVISTITLVAGMILGGIVGGAIQKRKAKAEIKQVTAQVKKEEQKKTKKAEEALQEELDKQEQKKELPWNLTLVNSTHSMADGYVPELTEIRDGYSVDSRIAEPLKEMLAAADQDGMNIIICSAYRSVEKQEQVFNSSVQDRLNSGMNYWEAYSDTALSVALPGTSEHGLGLSLDLISNQYTELDEKQAETKEAKWLEENCYKYGFILRYPPEKTEETGIIYEPWHYRYVGEEDAEKIMESGVTLEEYLNETY